MFFDGFSIDDIRVHQFKTKACHAVLKSSDIFNPADQNNNFIGKLIIIECFHVRSPLCIELKTLVYNIIIAGFIQK